jgi:hypothetical protein
MRESARHGGADISVCIIVCSGFSGALMAWLLIFLGRSEKYEAMFRVQR